MAKRFLTHIDLSGNQLVNASFEKLSADPVSNLFEGRMYYNTTSDAIKIYDGVQWVGIGEIVDIQGTTNEIEVSIVDGVATIGLPNTIYADVVGDLTGNADTATNATNADYATTAGTANAVAANSVALGTDTTGDYVASVSASDGISASGTGEGAAVSLTNTDKGSSQNIFKNISDGSTSVVADNNDDTVTFSAGTGISVIANATTDTLTIGNTGVTSIAGTTDQISVDSSTGSVTLSLPNDVVFPGTVTLDADPTADLHAATKQYVDAVAQGIAWKDAANLVATSNVSLTGTSGTLVIDGHAALGDADDGYRILLTNQSTASQDGIYVYSDNGSTYTLSRSADADVYTELVGASVFIMEGTLYANTGWVQSNHYLTGFSDQSWVQFSGAGAYTAGNGLVRTGTEFSIDTTITVDVNSTQTLTNKTLTSPSVSGLYLSDNSFVVEGTADAYETTVQFTDPTADRTITFQNASGTVAFTADITDAINAVSTTDIEEGTNLYFTDERAQDAVGNNISGSNSVSAIYNDTAGTFSFDTTLATTSYMSKSSGLAVDISSVETKLVTDGFTKKASADVGNGANTSFAITHSLGTRDVVVNIYDNSSYDTVEADVVRTDANTVTVSFASAPSSNAYRVVIVG